ncbi:MAG: hypothetical protein ACREQT_01550 [Candidatus Binataceae bacterium]
MRPSDRRSSGRTGAPLHDTLEHCRSPAIGVRRELDRRLAERDFDQLKDLLEWLARQGYRTSSTALFR